jgi:DNA-binding CsgD family transcriptional regulator
MEVGKKDEKEEMSIEKALPEGTLVCIKDLKGEVKRQNSHCKDFCGDMSGRVCEKYCMEYIDNLKLGTNSQLKAKCHFENKVFDLVLTESDNAIVSLLFAQDIGFEKRIEDLKVYGLTKQEFVVATMAIKGFSNKQIADKLFLSRLTVRSHLRNIYRKVPDSLFPKRNQSVKSS